MRARSPVRRCRQKTPGQPSYSIEIERNPDTMPQYFQISVNVLEGMNLAWMYPNSANSYVIVVLGKKKHRTSMRRNMLEPSFNEIFTFEMYTTIRDLQQMSIWLAVMEPRFCAAARLLGEATIDLGEIWSQPHHQVFHKWAQLSLPRHPNSGGVGFLKVDISIVFRGEVQVMPVVYHEGKKEDNLLLPSGSEQQPAKYVVTIYSVYSLPVSVYVQTDKRYNKIPSSFVRVSFCGITAETALQLRVNNAMFCEQISMVEKFPNMNDVVTIEVCSSVGSFTKTLGSVSLRLSQISHEGHNGFLPTFGPSLLHMYGVHADTNAKSEEEGPFYCGAILMSLRTVVPYYKHKVGSTSVAPVPPLQQENLWAMENFSLFCPILEISMVDRKVCGHIIGIAVTVGELPNDKQVDDEFVSLMSDIKYRKLYYTGNIELALANHGHVRFTNMFPVLQLAARLPDFRFRMYRNNMMRGIVHDLENSLQIMEFRLHNANQRTLYHVVNDLNCAADNTAASIVKFLDLVEYSSLGDNEKGPPIKYLTELDRKQIALQREEAEKIQKQMMKSAKCNNDAYSYSKTSLKNQKSFVSTKKEAKKLLTNLQILAADLKSTINKTSDGWPDIVIWLLNCGSRAAYAKIPLSEVVHGVIPEQSGRKCGRIQTVYLKPLKCPKHTNNPGSECFCISCKLEVILWIGLNRQAHTFVQYLPHGYKLDVLEYGMIIKTRPMILECRAFIHKAKLNTVTEDLIPLPAFVRVNILNSSMDTTAQPCSRAYVWNQVLKVRKAVPASPDRIIASPQNVLVEVFELGIKDLNNIIGRIEIEPFVDDRQEYEFAPKLQWYDIYKGNEQTGRILMSVQLCKIPDRFLQTTMCSSENVSFAGGSKHDTANDMNSVDVLPHNLVPQCATYKMDVYWWGLRDVTTPKKPCVVLEIDDLTIKANAVSYKSTNCNFINGKSSQTFSAPLQDAYAPPLYIRLYDSSTFGRIVFMGTNTVKNPAKYIVNWLPKPEREASLRSAAVDSSNFYHEKPTLHVRKKVTISENESSSSEHTDLSKNSKISQWKKWFCLKENEEEYSLLPRHVSEKDEINMSGSMSGVSEKKDWWASYFAAVENQRDENYVPEKGTTIYSKELESQPEFSKFKDWCKTIKLYNGNKTGIPEKDIKLNCGYLKAGIAIYKWPPPENTTAVSYHGVDLQKGYFHDHPKNDPSKFLVRVYIVKGIDLVSKAFTGSLDPYVMIHCGNKRFGDRKSHIKNTSNPTFGKMYEFRCTLPDDYLLTVSLHDYDTVPPDALIGSTTIDLEDRIYTKHRAMVGLASKYSTSGPNRWRDCYKPSVILEKMCSKNHLPTPTFPNSTTVIVNDVEYKEKGGRDKYLSTHNSSKEKICLSLLRKWHTLPVCGYHLVPEHVETRTLINIEQPGIELGKLQMWVDIFPLSDCVYIPPPVDITPRKLEEYEFRVVIRELQGIKVGPRPNKKKVPGVCVRAWMDTIEHAQYTDMDYNGYSGTCRFNWRMIFKFLYHHADKKLVRHWNGSCTDVQDRFPPLFVLQVLDNSNEIPEDFLGSLSFSLNAVPVPRTALLPRLCKIDQFDSSTKIDLFTCFSFRAWFPLVYTNRSTGYIIPAGKIDLELTLLPKDKAILMPVGCGRGPPCALPVPKRAYIPRKHQKLAAFCKALTSGCHLKLLAVIFISLVIMALITIQSVCRYYLNVVYIS